MNQGGEHRDPSYVIRNSKDLEEFHSSESYLNLVSFVERLNESVKNLPNSTPCTISPAVEKILNVLGQLYQLVQEIPPLPQRTRFANAAFCTYLDKVTEKIPVFMEEIVPADVTLKTELSREVVLGELGKYFKHCLGDGQRLDYGSGHELNFVMWLYCLDKIGLLSKDDYRALVLKIFLRYLEVMRYIQKTYWLEPAGSHGVWGLDDYQFLPFLWGSAQLIGHKYIRPKSICSLETVEAYGKEYMYLGCVQFINQVKTGSFFEHSPLLYDISGSKDWNKVNTGMIKMFKVEVLGKLPIMKHFFFGPLFPLELKEHMCEEGEDHHHHANNERDVPNASPLFRVNSCCVQKIPSAIGAKEFQKM